MIDPLTLAVAAEVRRQRRQRGWDQARLVEESGIPQSSLSKIETGRAALVLGQVPLLAHAFGMTAAELIALAEGHAGDAGPTYDSCGKLMTDDIRSTPEDPEFLDELIAKRSSLED